MTHKTFDNAQSSVNGRPATFRTLVKAMSSKTSEDESSPANRYLFKRLQDLQSTGGRLAEACQSMREGRLQAKDLGTKIKSIKLPEATSDETAEGIGVAHGFWASGITRSCILTIEENLDTHDAESAKDQPKTYLDVADKLSRVFKILLETPYGNNGQSLLDVTTVMISSEFARTMRQLGSNIDATGTDHNPHGNSVLLGGKGIQGGMILGATDQETITANISAAHRSVDPALLKALGKPFDFSAQKVRDDLPPAYLRKDYITISSIINSIYQLFDVPESAYWKLDRNEGAAPLLNSLFV